MVQGSTIKILRFYSCNESPFHRNCQNYYLRMIIFDSLSGPPSNFSIKQPANIFASMSQLTCVLPVDDHSETILFIMVVELVPLKQITLFLKKLLAVCLPLKCKPNFLAPESYFILKIVVQSLQRKLDRRKFQTIVDSYESTNWSN